jgi:hypothetical protein
MKNKKDTIANSKTINWALLSYDPLTRKKLKPIFKFNGGKGVVLCRNCGTIIKENISQKDAKNSTDLLFCRSCAMELITKIFKEETYDQGK